MMNRAARIMDAARTLLDQRSSAQTGTPAACRANAGAPVTPHRNANNSSYLLTQDGHNADISAQPAWMDPAFQAVCITSALAAINIDDSPTRTSPFIGPYQRTEIDALIFYITQSAPLSPLALRTRVCDALAIADWGRITYGQYHAIRSYLWDLLQS